ncbi:hypothetical protein ACOKM5_24310 [Streptomyces sp. BH097]|uniref:hypothetical protein n=1 Tax=Streptomyces sp. BH097 TaxID=3410406 RepID=UPI003CE98E65
MDTYSHSYGTTGHYRRPGTSVSYCGRDLLPEPNNGIRTRICQTCAKAEQRDRVEAEQVAADRATGGPTLAERAGVRYCTVGKGRRVHYSNNDDTLCGREVTEYIDGPDERHPELCARCITAAEERAYSRALAAASPLAAAAVELAETVEQADATALYDTYIATAEAAVERTRCTLHGDECDHDPRTPHHFADLHIGPPIARTTPPTICPEFATLDPADLIADEWRTAAALVTEAEAADGTWRGEWIGEQVDDGLFTLDRPSDQGALFS